MKTKILERYAFAQTLIKDAGQLALSFYTNRHSLQIECKQNNKQDEVSIADKQVEQFIRNSLYQHFPDDGFLGEEFGANAIEQEFCWVVDPIDGTSPFLHGLHAWCISIALLHGANEIVCGLIFDPLHNELFHCYQGGGAFLNEKAIQTNQKAKSVHDGLIGLGMSHRVTIDTFIPMIEEILKNKGMYVRNGSGALTLAQVAAGRLIGYYEPHLNAWDSLAGVLLIQEAGGCTNNFLEDSALIKGNYILAAANSNIYTQLETFRP